LSGAHSPTTAHQLMGLAPAWVMHLMLAASS
jgi:hypothetical protein